MSEGEPEHEQLEELGHLYIKRLLSHIKEGKVKTQEREQKTLKTAWDEGYAAAVRNITDFDADGSTTPNPYNLEN